MTAHFSCQIEERLYIAVIKMSAATLSLLVNRRLPGPLLIVTLPIRGVCLSLIKKQRIKEDSAGEWTGEIHTDASLIPRVITCCTAPSHFLSGSIQAEGDERRPRRCTEMLHVDSDTSYSDTTYIYIYVLLCESTSRRWTIADRRARPIGRSRNLQGPFASLIEHKWDSHAHTCSVQAWSLSLLLLHDVTGKHSTWGTHSQTAKQFV